MGKKKTKNKRKLRDFLAVIKKYDISPKSDPHSIRLALEELGPTFVKLGQLIAAQSDLFPQDLCSELRCLRDEVAPMSEEQVDQVIYDAYGRKKEEIFSYFDDEAHGSASISQVHHARLASGEDVAVKIQRVGALETMERDIDFLRRLVKRIPFLKKNPYIDLSEVLNELWDITHLELDFTNEAKNLERFYQLNQDVKYVSCPKVYQEFTTSTVIVMEYIKGIKMSDKEALLEKGYDINEIGKKYVHSFLKQIFVDGFFQADPHTGNIKISGGRIVWYDMGMMGEFSENDKSNFIDAIEGIITGDSLKNYEAITQMCLFRHKYDKEALFKDVEDYISSLFNLDIKDMDVGMEVKKFMQIAKKHKASINPSQTIMCRGLTTIQATVTENFPEIDFFTEIKRFTIDLRLSKKRKQDDSKDVEKFKKHLKMKKILQIPENIANMVELYSKGLTPVKMEMGIPEKSQEFFTEIVRMIVDGFIIVALLVSSSIIVLSGIKPFVWGIPLLGFAGYSLAVLMVVINFIKKLIKK